MSDKNLETFRDKLVIAETTCQKLESQVAAKAPSHQRGAKFHISKTI